MNTNYIEEINLRPTKPVLVVSDIHLGQRSIELEIVVINTLLKLTRQYSLIINGDLFELWKYGRFGWDKNAHFEKFEQIWETHKSLLTELLLNTPDVFYIHGNHDFLLSQNETPFKVHRRIILGEPDNKCRQIIITHGNDGDGYANSKMMKRMKYLFASGVDYAANKLYNFVGFGTYEKDRVTDIIYVGMGRERKYISYAKTLGYRNVVFGHTHQLGAVFDHDFFYYNSGCCLLNIQGVCIDGDDIYLRVWPFEGPK